MLLGENRFHKVKGFYSCNSLSTHSDTGLWSYKIIMLQADTSTLLLLGFNKSQIEEDQCRALFVVAAGCLVCLPKPSFSQVTTKDPLTEFFAGRGFSNIPYGNQSEAKPGGLVTAPFDGASPTFWSPGAEVPALADSPSTIPGSVVADLKSGGLELNLFGLDLSTRLSNYKSLTFSTIPMAGVKITPEQIDALIVPGSPTDVKMRSYVNSKKGPLGGIYFKANLYLIGKVFSTTSADISSTDGTEISFSNGAKIPACADLPGATATPPKDSTTPADPKAKPDPTGTTPAKPAPTPAGQDGVNVNVDLGAQVAQTVKAATAAAEKIAGADIPTGTAQFCSKSTGQVHFTSAQAIPVAMSLYQLHLYDNKWVAESVVVSFYPHPKKQ
jgi:hypothetical protein